MARARRDRSVRSWLRVLGTAPWRRGPLLLARRPGVALALVAAAFVATVPAASAGPFLSAARSATLHHQFGYTCPSKVGEHIESAVAFRSLWTDGVPYGFNGYRTLDAASARRAYAARHAALLRDTTGVPGLTAPVTTLKAVTVQRPAGSTGPFPDNKFWLVGRSDNFGAHLNVLAGPSGRGVWVPDTYAAEQGLRVGDRFEIATMSMIAGRSAIGVDPTAAPARLRVAAIYTDLRSRPDDPYWCPLVGTYRTQAGDNPLLPVLFTDLNSFADAAVASPRNVATEFVDMSLTNPRLTAPQAHAVAARIAALRLRLAASGAVASIYTTADVSALAGDAARADLVRAALVRTVLPAAAAGTLIGLAIVAAAAGFWLQRRRRELRVLAAHGAGPVTLGLKAASEAGAALLAGAVAGVVASWALATTIGPSGVLSGEALPLAVAAAVGSLAACLLVTTVTAIGGARRLTDARPARRRHVLLPWELLALAAVPVLWWWFGDTRQQVDQPGGFGAVAHLPVRLIVVPILVFLAASVLAARLAALWLRRRAATRTPRGTVRYLASRRMARPAFAAVLLGAATALPVALAGFGATVTDSTRMTLHAKAAMILGADTVATLNRPAPVPAALSARTTQVLRIDALRVGDYTVDVLGIDPATFARGAYWNWQIPGPGLAARVAGLHAGAHPNGVSYGVLPAGEQTVVYAGRPVATIDVRPTGLLPGAQSGFPILLVHRDALTGLVAAASRQWWISGDPATARAALENAGAPVGGIRVPEDGYGGSVYEPVTYTFQYLVALAIFIGTVATVGLLLYLEARAAAHARAYVLMRRMGLRPRTHLGTVYAEIGAPLAVGFAAGLIMAAGTVWAGRGDVDLLPGFPPEVLLAVPAGLLAGLAAAVALVSAAAAVYAHARVRRARPGEVLRETT